jgi:signal transduction histidine kinase/diacylglycerol kinase family enzyme/FixJ family two-component response regulator
VLGGLKKDTSQIFNAARELKHQQMLLHAVNDTAQVLLASMDEDKFEASVLKGMEIIAHCLDVDRGYIWQNEMRGGVLHYAMIFEWQNDTGRQTNPVENKVVYPYSDIPSWQAKFLKGECVNGPLNDLSQEEKDRLLSHGMKSVFAIPVNLQNTFWGWISFDDCRRERSLTEDELNILRSVSLMLANAINHNEQEIQNRETHRQRNNLLHTVNNVAAGLLQAEVDEFENALVRCMGMMGEAVSADRVYIWRNHSVDGKLHCTQMYEWSEGSEPQQGNQYTIDIPYSENMPDWEEKLSSGQCINGLVRDMAAKAQAQFSPQGILSILVVPVFLREQFWGFVGFDDCHRERIFTENEESILRSGSLLITHAMLRNDLTLSLRSTATELMSAFEDAQDANRAKSEFLAAMSHEIRTPMNAIIGITQIQLQNENLPDEYTAALEKIFSSGNSLLGIINDILDMSKIETGKMELNLAEYDVPSLINDAVQLNIVRIGSKPIEFMLDLDENLPFKLYGDELRLKQILNNLLSNAIKYTKKGIVKLSVNYSSEGEDIMLCFVVEDTGQGLKNEDKERLFSEYMRFNAEANRTTEGTGLGLNITKKLEDMMDGTIGVESEYGKGSVFTVTVKQKAVECGAIGAEVAQKLRNFTFTGDRQTAKLQIKREPMPYGNVLVVDDVETNLYVAEGLLSPYKLKIETTDSGFAAIEKIQSGKTYDIIFMDHMMPKMDGIETTEKLRRLGYNGTIVALTANALTGNDELFSQHGFDGFIPKPIDIHRLNTVLNKFIRDKHYKKAEEHKPEPQKAVPRPDSNEEKVEKGGPIRHLFIINPVAKRIKGKIKLVKDKISAFFAKHPEIKYDIYVSEWCRDAVMFIQGYTAGITDETVRVHSIGGTGTLFEIINSVAGLPNVEIAVHPYGKANAFLRYFGNKNMKLFHSLESQVFDKAVPMDIVRCGNNYGICYGMTGIEAYANVLGDKWIEKGMPIDLSYMLAGMLLMLRGKVSQNYFIEIDGDKIEGDFISVMVANAPCYGKNMYPAIDAHPDDGMLDVYVFKSASKIRLLRCVPSHTHGNYRKLPDLVSHYRAKKIKLSSDEVMCMSIDCEHFYGTSIEYEIMPKAVRFVCPAKIDPMKLPRIYNRPQEGLRSE